MENDSEGIRLPPSLSGLYPQPSRLLGRENEVAAIRALVLAEGVRLLTLTGPGGVGKTRLALEVAHELRSHFAEGLVFVELTTVRDPDHVLAAVGASLGFQDLDSHVLFERLQAYLGVRELLLVLDNVEQVLSAAPRLVELLVACPHLTYLVTSREPLHLRWERTFHVSPLKLPDPRHLPATEELSQIPSVALFLQRARTINPDFALGEDNAQVVGDLVVHLDGLPLAIELAAARTALFSPRMILERLGQRLSLLRWPAHDLPQRQQTLRSAIAWSYDLLSLEEQALFRRLGVFAGSFSLRAAEAIANPLGIDAIEALASLVDKSLIQVQANGGSSVRYALLESLREYALERLAEAGELEEACRTHALYYLALAERADLELTGREQRLWIGRLERAHENIRAALRWLVDHDGERALRLAAALGYFWEARGYMAEGRRLLEQSLARAPDANARLRARALNGLGVLLMWTAGDKVGADGASEIEHAKAVLTDGLELARSAQERLIIARSHSCLAVLGLFTKEWDSSKRHLEEALTYWQEAQYAWGIASYYLCRGVLEVSQGNHERAAQLLERSAALYRESGDESARGRALSWLADALEGQGDLSGAVRVLQDLLALAGEANDPRLLLLGATGVLWVRRRQGEPEQLARLLGAAETVRRTTGIAYTVSYRTRVELTREALQFRLGLEGLEAALAAGRSMPLNQLTALLDDALQVSASETVTPEQRSATVLSPREQEVLQLVAEGRSNKQIAKELIIAESTAKSYVTGVFNKLGVDTRARAVAVAAQRGLLEPWDS